MRGRHSRPRIAASAVDTSGISPPSIRQASPGPIACPPQRSSTVPVVDIADQLARALSDGAAAPDAAGPADPPSASRYGAAGQRTEYSLTQPEAPWRLVSGSDRTPCCSASEAAAWAKSTLLKTRGSDGRWRSSVRPRLAQHARRARAAPPRGERRRTAEPPQHRCHLRRPRRRLPALHRHGVRRRREPRARAPPRGAAARQRHRRRAPRSRKPSPPPTPRASSIAI